MLHLCIFDVQLVLSYSSMTLNVIPVHYCNVINMQFHVLNYLLMCDNRPVMVKIAYHICHPIVLCDEFQSACIILDVFICSDGKLLYHSIAKPQQLCQLLRSDSTWTMLRFVLHRSSLTNRLLNRPTRHYLYQASTISLCNDSLTRARRRIRIITCGLLEP
jgi:hypothetical protein